MELPRAIPRAIGLLLGIIIGGIVGYRLIEGWSFTDAAWMVVITLTTIGFGEIHPLSPTGRWFTMGLIIAGVGVGAYAMGQITQLAVEGELGRWVRARRWRREMSALSGHYIVIGYGRLGRAVVAELLSSGARVCVIERGPILEELRHKGHSVPFFIGDGAEDAVLRQAGIDRARGVAITAAPVADAIFATLSVRQLHPTVPILTRIEHEAEAAKARRAGATAVVSPLSMGGWRMAHGLLRPHASSFFDIATLAEHDDLQLEEIPIASVGPAVGRTLAELAAGERSRVLVVAIRRSDGRMVATPAGDARVDAGDVLIVIGEPQKVRAYAELLQPTSGA